MGWGISPGSGQPPTCRCHPLHSLLHSPSSTSGPPVLLHPGAFIPAVPVPWGPGDRAGFLSELKPDRALSKAKDGDEMPCSGDASGSSPPPSSRTVQRSSTTSGRGVGSSMGQSHQRTMSLRKDDRKALQGCPLPNLQNAHTGEGTCLCCPSTEVLGVPKTRGCSAG